MARYVLSRARSFGSACSGTVALALVACQANIESSFAVLPEAGVTLPNAPMERDAAAPSIPSLEGGATAPPASGADAACAATAVTAHIKPLNVHLMVDVSGSMDEPTGTEFPRTSKLDAVRAALIEFLSDPASRSLTVGLQRFPVPVTRTTVERDGPDSCDVADYTNPLVPFVPLSSQRNALVTAISALTPDGYTPTGPALKGAIAYAGSRLSTHPGEAAAVILVTDGLPSICVPMEIEDIAEVAAQGHQARVPTYVVGVFGELEAAVAQANLGALAKAGGTSQAILVDTANDVAKDLGAALASIRSDAIPCTLAIPQPDAGAIAYDSINVSNVPSGGGAVSYSYVGSASGCAKQNGTSAGGWHYDVDPTSGGVPTSIVLCKNTCDAVRADSGGTLSILVGCATVHAAPK